MLEKLKQRIANASRIAAQARKRFDPSVLNDDIATKTSWRSLDLDGANFNMRYLLELTPDHWEWRGTAAANILSFFFMCFGMTLIGLLYMLLAFEISTVDLWPKLIMLVMGIGAIAMGFNFYYRSNVCTNFDRSDRIFRKGNRSVTFDEIHALQLIHTRRKRSYHYELNLILDTTKRMHVVSYTDYKEVRTVANRLADFLKKPVWDAIPWER